jgi:hypothetical protein
MQAIVDAFTRLFSKVTQVLTWIGELWKAIFLAGWDFIKDGFCWALESLLKIAVGAVQAVNVGGITENMSVWGSIPANVLEVCAALGLGTAFAIITAAIGVRLVLQLIPFTRLGS